MPKHAIPNPMLAHCNNKCSSHLQEIEKPKKILKKKIIPNLNKIKDVK
jgi:hypothetical protein